MASLAGDAVELPCFENSTRRNMAFSKGDTVALFDECSVAHGSWCHSSRTV